LIALKLRGLDSVVSSSAVDPVRDGRGWAFREGRGHGPDPVNGFALLQDAYLATDPTFAGHISVPALWDRVEGRLVSNHYATMIVDLETQFAEWADPDVRLYPEDRRAEIDAVNTEIVGSLATATYQAMGATTQARYDDVVDRVYAALDDFEQRLSRQRYLVGDSITDADLLLYVQLVRFDTVAVPLGRLTRRRLVDHPNLWAYARDLYQRPAFLDATDFDHIVRGTFGTGAGIRTHRVVPALPDVDWNAPHGRASLDGDGLDGDGLRGDGLS
jgi:putative glutathione S-transferase